MRIVIVGAGIAGLAVAAALRGRGHSITIYERAQRLSPVGAGFTLQPNGIERLASLGVAERIRSVGSPVDRSFVSDWQGNEIPVDTMKRLSGGSPFGGVPGNTGGDEQPDPPWAHPATMGCGDPRRIAASRSSWTTSWPERAYSREHA